MKIFALLTVIITTFSISAGFEAVCLTQGCNGRREYCDSTIDGCNAGYKCVDDLCRVAADPVDGRTCHTICPAGKFCENGALRCRAPSFDGECFNLETGFFQDGCKKGYYCSFNKCVDTSLED